MKMNDENPQKKSIDGNVMFFSVVSICIYTLGIGLYKCLYRDNKWIFDQLSFGDAVGIFCLSLGFTFISFLFWIILGLAFLKYFRGHKEIDMPVSYSELDDSHRSPQHWSVAVFVCGFGAAMLYLKLINY